MKTSIKIILTLLLTIIISCSEDKIDYTGTGKITGRVIQKDNFTPLENAKITINSTNNSVFTDENGEYIFEDIPEGEYSLEAEKEEYINGFEPVTVTAEQSVNIIIELQRSDALNNPPSSVQLISPQDNTTDIGVSTIFNWEEALDNDDDSLTYRLEIKNDINNEIISIENISETSYEISELNYGVKYFWQVIVSDGVNNDVYSEIFTFETLDFPNNRYLYTRIINGNNVIFSSDASGNEIQLTDNENNCWRPRKNQISNKIAFLKINNGEIHIFTMNIDGSNQQQVTSSIQPIAFKNNEIDFSWSTNGSKLIYPHFDKLYKINVDGTGNSLVYQTNDGSFITECVWSNNGNIIVIKTNNSNGYEARVFTINSSGNFQNSIIENVSGALGGIDITTNNNKILYTYDISGFEDTTYRQLNTHLFIYTISTGTTVDYSNYKENGTNDLDAKFSPNESKIIYVNTSNDGISERKILTVDLNNDENRNGIFENAMMPDWQ